MPYNINCNMKKHKESDIKPLRIKLNCSQSEFCKMFEIPLYTLQDWEQCRRTPPTYIAKLVKRVIEAEQLAKD